MSDGVVPRTGAGARVLIGDPDPRREMLPAAPVGWESAVGSDPDDGFGSHVRRDRDNPVRGTLAGDEPPSSDRSPGAERPGRRSPRSRRAAGGESSGRPARAGPPGRLDRFLSRWLPGPVAARLDPGRAGAAALVLVVIVAAGVAAFGVWASRPEVQPVAALPSVSSGPDGASATSAAPPPGGPIVVSVVGKVARPGLVRVGDGARVADAVDAAGGPLPGVDLSVLNLARRVGDGEQIAVGVPVAPDAAPGAGPASGTEPGAPIGEPLPSGGSAPSAPTAGSSAPGGKVDLNRATAGELDALPGVGPATAAKILDWRTKNGRFARVEQLREVDGIGERRYAQLAPLVTV